MYSLPAEWYEQDGVMLTWPHQGTDMAPFLEEVYPVYCQISQEITKRQKLLVVVRDQILKSEVENQFISQKIDLNQVIFVIAPSDDVWARDHGPITLVNNQGQIKILDFVFNGWGNKYKSFFDNQINRHIIYQIVSSEIPTESILFVLEGGAIESDGEGRLLTTKACLLNPNRNPQFNQKKIEELILQKLGSQTIIWLEHGYLEGDDTDSHIDTLVRFAPNNTLLYVTCDDQKDIHYQEFQRLEAELKSLKTEEGKSYNLIPLPWPQPKYNYQGDRLPATYANYLIINRAVLLPTYRDKADGIALKQIKKAYPDREIIGIDCLPLLNQFGSLHCISMQLPKGFIRD